MATVVMSAIGAVVGSAVGGSVLGVSSAVIGQAVGASIGATIDARAMAGSASVEVGRLDTARFSGAGEGAPLPWLAGRARVPGQMIWSTRFLETISKKKESVGNPKSGNTLKTTRYSYSVSFALALCEGEISRIGRVWADGVLLDLDRLTWRLHRGTNDQDPDPLIEAVEGEAPAYRGVAYLVFEGFGLGAYGNRIPQISVEVFRRPQSRMAETDGLFAANPMDAVEGVALIPGTGEYSLASDPVALNFGPGSYHVQNVNSGRDAADLNVALDGLASELPNASAALLVVSWFGDDLRAGDCSLRPKVEQVEFDSSAMPWAVSGLVRKDAQEVSKTGGRVNFGGTPCDASVAQALQEMRARGQFVTFYPFILMDVPAGNGLADPYGGAEQSRFPWRGRITTALAPGQSGTTDQTAAAGAEVAAFMGTAVAGDFEIVEGLPVYQGPEDWGFRRMILHYAHLCAAAGGVDAFCIGSELRALTQIRDGAGSYPFVAALQALAAEVRGILGPEAKIGYAADWSEYFGHQPGDGSGDVFYHLDPLWADPEIDFVGIDNYLPLSDWREGEGHADAGFGSLYNPEYLRGNVEGGEGYDWYYASDADRAAQVRTPIVDGAHGEDHIYRPKDLTNWWGRAHFNRPGGVREVAQTAWEPESKPIWFTEYGCPAIDKGTNQPNVFVDEISSESSVPYFSTGARDDFIQYRYIEAVTGYWGDPENNPTSYLYDGPMVDMTKAHVWAWDARPWPSFPSRTSVWSDGPNYARGHWMSGRAGAAPVSEVIAELAGRVGYASVDVSGVHGGLPGVEVSAPMSARAALQPVLLAGGVDAVEAGQGVRCVSRDARVAADLSAADWVFDAGSVQFERVRAAVSDGAERVRVSHYASDRAYQRGVVESGAGAADEVRLPVVLSTAAAKGLAERLLAEVRAGAESLTFGLPPNALALEPGDVVAIESERYRVVRIEDGAFRSAEAVRIDPAATRTRFHPEELYDEAPVAAVGPVQVAYLDLPLMRGDEVEHAPHVAASSEPWPGAVAVLSGADEEALALDTQLDVPAVMGVTTSVLPAGRPDLWQRVSLEVQITRGAFEAATERQVLGGANLAALEGPGQDWELVQFQEAQFLGSGIWRLSGFLRGQFGTEAVQDGDVPVGRRFVLMDGATEQLDLAPGLRGLEQVYRAGPADRDVDDPTFFSETRTFEGVGLRPYAPAHLRADVRADGLHLTWVRRTRVEGDRWRNEVPLGEEAELYRVELWSGGALALSRDVTGPEAVIEAAALPGGAFEVRVAQVSARWGAGVQSSEFVNV